MTKYVQLALIVVILCTASCHGQQKNENMEQYLPAEDTSSDIGVIHLGKMDISLYSKPDDKSKFATIKTDSRHPKLYFSQKKIKDFFNPLYFYYSESYDRNGGNRNHNKYISRDLTFRVISFDGDWFKIVFDEKEHRTCFLKNEKKEVHFKEVDIREIASLEDHFQTWESYFIGESRSTYDVTGKRSGSIVFGRPRISLDNQQLYNEVNGDTIFLEDRSSHFLADSVQGDWMYIVEHRRDDERVSGWLKWRDGNKILISYKESWWD